MAKNIPKECLNILCQIFDTIPLVGGSRKLQHQSNTENIDVNKDGKITLKLYRLENTINECFFTILMCDNPFLS